ncbi:hypothetical protein QBC42DRAFT_298623 [Cladorrhinum samala]|uniref:DUF2828 domain-containing protein n=1 Tax=Cladorrhinum samala TaxID=585594 RepID=A0AAV9HI30_9PEZI|nr:hypothetical protein QBC42DRAFT_298623 [Cladorrhinum samala]
MDESKDGPEVPWFLRATYPVLLPEMAELAMPEEDFAEYLSDAVRVNKAADINLPGSKFMEALQTPTADLAGNYMLTENDDVAFGSSTSALVDLFYELEETVSGPRLNQLLHAAWAEDALLTVKIIFNARSIHLGKSSRKVFYRCAGWLLRNHPLTLITSLRWLTRPVIPAKVEKEEDNKEEDAVLVSFGDGKPEQEEDRHTRFDVANGVSHGYWKDVLNMLALAANGKLGADQDPGELLNMHEPREVSKIKGVSDPQVAKARRCIARATRKQGVSRLVEEDAVYRALHLSVARLFAEQIKADLALLREAPTARAKRGISLCGKWAPSSDRFHDKHTLIASSIAEILHPQATFAGSAAATADRETYLRYAREHYRRDVSALREHLDVVERKLTANAVSDIKYDQVPSIAMNTYRDIFFRKDAARFREYLGDVAGGKARIGAESDTIAPKPLTDDKEGVSLVSGYSPDMLDKRVYDDAEEEEEIGVEEEDEDGVVMVVRNKQKMDPQCTVKKAVSHKAYDMLKVVD